MKRFVCLFVALTLLLTAGCRKTEDSRMQQALDFRAELLSGGGCTFTAQVRADYGDTAETFTLDCRFDPESDFSFEVAAPETIRGIRGSVRGTDACVEFDGTQLVMDLLAGGRLAPLAGPAAAAQCWAGDYIAAVGPDGDLLRVSYLQGYEGQELTADTWFSDGKPVRAELSCDGVTVLFMEITDFELSGGT